MRKLLNLIDTINNIVAKCVSFFIYPIIAVILYDVTMRYILVRPQGWAPEISVYLFGASFVLGAGYVYAQDSHIKLDIVYIRLSKEAKAIIDLITSIIFFIFCWALIWKGTIITIDSVKLMEKSVSSFAPLLFPIKLIMPIGVILLFLQGVTRFIRNIYIVAGKNYNEH